jgi:hypothetical protein
MAELCSPGFDDRDWPAEVSDHFSTCYAWVRIAGLNSFTSIELLRLAGVYKIDPVHPTLPHGHPTIAGIFDLNTRFRNHP